MMNNNFRSFFLILSGLLQLSFLSTGQEKTVNVERCKALDQTSPIHNIWVDSDNIKWVANSHGLNKVFAMDLVEKVTIPAGTTSLLTIRGGNAQMEWNTNEMQQLMGNVNISCASFDPKSKTLWVGTKESGAFQISVSPLRIIQRLNTDNKKLTSNQINDIFIRPNGTVFVATNDGMLTGSGDKWTLQERYLNFIGVDAWGDNLWILGDDFLWHVDNKGKWSPIAIDLRNVEGQIRDIAVDDEGRVWIASNMMTGYDVEADKYQRFGPGQYFTSQFVNCLDVDQDGSIWTGTADKGLYLIQWESSLILNITMDIPPDCQGQSTAELSTKVAGGQPPYKFMWSNNAIHPKISLLGAGEYQLTVTDANGLIKTGKYTIPDPGIKILIEQSQSASSPSAADAIANVIVQGGTGQFMYAWDNGEMTPTATKLTSGPHTVTVTDKSGCSAWGAITLVEIIAPLSVNVVVSITVKCASTPDGELRAEIKGGKSPYDFAWSSGGGKGATLSSLGAGSYTVSVTDATGQKATAAAVLAMPPSLSASIQVITPASANASNGQAQAKASGGKPPYTYLWNNGEINAANKTLAPGQAVLTVTDANGCTSAAAATITENITAMNAAIKQSGEMKCGGENVDVMVEVTGGKGPYTYNWNDGQKTQKIQQVKAGEYQVTITDVIGAFATAQYVVKQPDIVNVSTQSEGAASTNGNDGQAIAKATGGNGAYTYNWDNGEKLNKAIKLSAGKHSVTVTDGVGCTGTGQVEISEYILALQVTIDQLAEIKCAGDAAASVKSSVTGGKEPYTYNWSNGSSASSLSTLKDGLFTLIVTDAIGHTASSVIAIDAPLPLTMNIAVDAPASTNGSDGRAIANVSGGKEKYTYLWDNGEKTSRAEKLNAGTHKLIVTDENGCTVEGTVIITENILPLAAGIKQTTEITCFGQKMGALNAEVKGGKEPYTFLWNNSTQNWDTRNINNLGAGEYTLKITDVTGNSTTSQYLIKEPQALQIQVGKISPASTGNVDGEVTLKVSGGTLPYSFRNTALPTNTAQITIDKLSPGLVDIVVTDAGGCSAGTSVTITEDILPLSASVKETRPVLCAGSAEGTLEASAKGGKPPYNYLWSSGHTGATFTNVQAGAYTLTVKDASGQESKIEYTVKAPAPMIVEIVNLRSATNDRISDGKGGAEIKGGQAPFKYSWSSGETTSSASLLPLGKGQVIVTDQNGCTSVAEYLVKEKVLAELTAERLASGEPIRMEKIQFQADSIKVEPEAIPSLDELYEFLYDNPTTIIEVAGHTNGLPADDYCDRISSERAKSVADYLINKGIESRRVISKGYGKRKPVAPNQTAEGRKKNQRVEIRLIKIEE